MFDGIGRYKVSVLFTL